MLRETGDIFFFYRPEEDREAVRSIEDVAELLICLNPDDGSRYRLLGASGERMPSPHAPAVAGRSRLTVRAVCSGEDLRRFLTSETRLAWTGDEPFVPPARLVADGRYGLYEADGETYLAFVREVPRRAGPVQQAFGIVPTGLYRLALLGPFADPDAPWPQPLRDWFGEPGPRQPWIAPVEPEWLDIPGAVFGVSGAGVRPERTLGIRLYPDPHTLRPPTPLRELRYPRDRDLLLPMLRGVWR